MPPEFDLAPIRAKLPLRMQLRLAWIFVALGVAGVTAAPALPAPSGAFPYSYVHHTLPNGLGLILIPLPSNGLVAYYSVVRTGSRDEVEPGKSGFAHFFEHMMFRGTKRYPAQEYEAVLTRIGASTNAYTTADRTVYHLNFTADDLEQVIDVESDRFQNLAYSEEAFMTEAGAVYGEYRKFITHPLALLHEKMSDLAFDVHTYQHTTIGFERDIQEMPRQFDYSRTFFERFYRPDNVTLVIVGAIEPEATRALVERYYGGWKAGYTPPRVVPEPPQRQERTAEVAYPGRTLPILQLAFRGAAFDPSDRTFLGAVLLNELAFGETSTLRKQLVFDEQKVQALSSRVPLARDEPLFEITAMVKRPEEIEAVRESILRTIADYQETLVEPERLVDVKRRQRYAFLMSLDTPDAVASVLATYVGLTGNLASVDRLFAGLAEVTPEDVRRAARTYFVSERRNVIVMKGTQP